MSDPSPYRYMNNSSIGTVLHRVPISSMSPVCAEGWDYMVWEASSVDLWLS